MNHSVPSSSPVQRRRLWTAPTVEVAKLSHAQASLTAGTFDGAYLSNDTNLPLAS